MHNDMFGSDSINFEILKKRAHNLRWAAVPEGVIPLTAADPDFPCAPEISEAVAKFAAERYYCYGAPEGMPEFRQSMARYFAEKRNFGTNERLILPVDSAAFGIYSICKAYLSTGDEAIIFDPVDFLFRYSIEQVGGIAVTFPIPPATDSIDIDELEKLISRRTRLICLCNPLNPTGKVFKKEELVAVAALAAKYDLYIMSDEIWSDIVFHPHQYTSMASVSAEAAARTITVTGFSKSYGLAGLRIGAVTAPDEESYKRIIEASLHRSTVHGANVLSQVAAATALNECRYWLDAFVQHLHRMRELLVSGLNTVPGFRCIAPEGCYVAFVNIQGTGKTSQEIQETLLHSARVAVVPGLKQWFGDGAEGYIRLSFATSAEVLEEALSRIKKVAG